MKIVVINLGRAMRRIGIFMLVFAVLTATLVSGYGISQITIEAATVLPDDTDTGRVIIIDPGHGGEDPGAVGVSGVYEKTLNLEIALLLGEILTEQGYTVVYTRKDDRMLYSDEENIKGIRKLSDLKNRVKFTEEYPVSLFISIHMNSFGDGKYSGLQVYHTEGNSKSIALANSVQSSVRSNLQASNNRAIKSGKNIYLLENCHTTGILIECGFLSNAEECDKLSQKEYQKQLSFAISCGIIEYIKKQND